VDGDGRDEIIYGACAIDDDGRGLYSTELGHGDALHVGDLDPSRPGLEVFNIHERPKHPHGVSFRDARTGEILWSKESPDVARGVAFDIDPRHAGSECWAAGEGLRGLWNAQGKTISERKPRSCNFGLWWDGDPQRELLSGTTISKWNWQEEQETTLLRAVGCRANNGSKSTPTLVADLLGDWREEVIWPTTDGRELRLYTTTIPTRSRRVTWMDDRQYRLSVAWQNVGYNQPPHPSFFVRDLEQPLEPAGDESK
jgi:rhamnogalacturonan endolyase